MSFLIIQFCGRRDLTSYKHDYGDDDNKGGDDDGGNNDGGLGASYIVSSI